MASSNIKIALDRFRLFKAPPLIVFDANTGRAIRRGWTLVGEDVTNPLSYQRNICSMSEGLYGFLVADMDLVSFDAKDADMPEWYSKFLDFEKVCG